MLCHHSRSQKTKIRLYSVLIRSRLCDSISTMKKLLFLLLPLWVGLTSCAYVQTHKNVQEYFVCRQGDRLEAPLELVKVGDRWYVRTQACAGGVTKQYPAVHDEILLDSNNEPRFVPGQGIAGKPHLTAWPISSGTAVVLMREDGYATLQTLADEMVRNRSGRLDTLPASVQFYPVKAEIAGAEKAVYLLKDADTEPQLSFARRAAVQADRVLVDWPLTAVYNCAIPVMAPFVFFNQFLNEE